MLLIYRPSVFLQLQEASSVSLTISEQASFAEGGSAEEFHVSKEVSILALSLYVEGLGLGPLLVGPLSEVYGRNVVYRVSLAMLFLFSIPVAFAPNVGMVLVSCFIRPDR
jgi:MFS family permease